MRYRTVCIRMWGDKKFKSLSPMPPSGQGLFLYLLTNPNTNSIPGLYRAGAHGMSEELKWHIEDFHKAFNEIREQGLVKADFDARVIFIPNAIKYNKPQSPNVIRHYAKHFEEIPECDLKDEAYRYIKEYVKSLGEAYLEAFEESFDKSSNMSMTNQDQEQYQKQDCNDVVSKADSDTNNSSNCPHEEIVSLYHKILTMCPPVRVWTKARKSYLRQRWNENIKHQNLDWWRDYFNHVKQSSFLTGKVAGRDGKPPFIATLEWLIKPNNFVKVIEGNYHGESL